MRESIWKDDLKLSNEKELLCDITTDVLIIGGGICGILCAYFLKEKGIDYILTEGERIATKTTLNTTAKITSQHGLIYTDILKKYGKESALKYLKVNEEAILKYKEICKNTDCDFEEKYSSVYTLGNIKKLEEELNTLNSLGFDAYFTKETELPFKVKGAINFKGQAQFNPAKFISQISKNLNIYENTYIKKISGNYAYTKNHKIKAKVIIVATHFPFINTHGMYFLKLYQERSYVSAFKTSTRLEGMYVDENDLGLSFRSYKDLILIGGNNHRTGKENSKWDKINSFKDKYYPDLELKFMWANQDCISLDNIPYIGLYSNNTPNLYVATGFNKWGMTSSMVSAMILTDMILGKKNEYQDVFSPQRKMYKPKLLVNGLESTINLISPATKRCSHLGCALKWNKKEHTWDCPCHGSRFDKDGKVINNPAKKNIDID
ncbi:MAG: FAD-dependent oxidoreductase [Ruminococcaceae bacterium]|nr:FAD-dependent oxidoreductase [Oscillospiraceae bacterium]